MAEKPNTPPRWRQGSRGGTRLQSALRAVIDEDLNLDELGTLVDVLAIRRERQRQAERPRLEAAA